MKTAEEKAILAYPYTENSEEERGAFFHHTDKDIWVKGFNAGCEKTYNEAIEALKELKNYSTVLSECMYESDTLIVSESTASNLILSAFKEGQSNPKIKALKWEFVVSSGLTSLDAKTPFGDYFIIEDSYSKTFDLGVPFETENEIRNFTTLDGAKAKAQADFEKRVKECLNA